MKRCQVVPLEIDLNLLRKHQELDITEIEKDLILLEFHLCSIWENLEQGTLVKWEKVDNVPSDVNTKYLLSSL